MKSIDGTIGSTESLVKENNDFGIITFKTKSVSKIKIFVNEKYLSTIDKFEGCAIKVQPGTYRFSALFKDNSENIDYIHASSGTQYDVVLSHTLLETHYSSKAVIANIKGTKVNFREEPDTSTRNNIIDQLNDNDRVEILDRRVIHINDDYRITKHKTKFYIDGSDFFDIDQGVSLKVLSVQSNGYCQVQLETDEKLIIGEVYSNNLESIKESDWYKINHQGRIGWVYGSFIRN